MLGTWKEPALVVKATIGCSEPAAKTSTIAPICGVPSALLTTPEMEPVVAAHTGSAAPNSTTNHLSRFAILSTLGYRTASGSIEAARLKADARSQYYWTQVPDALLTERGTSPLEQSTAWKCCHLL